MNAAETKTATARKIHDQIQALRARGWELRQTLAAVREEIARGFDNEVEADEYDASETYLAGECSATTEQIRTLLASGRKAGLGELIQQLDMDVLCV